MRVELKCLFWILEMEFFQALILYIFTNCPGLNQSDHTHEPEPSSHSSWEHWALPSPGAAPCRQGDWPCAKNSDSADYFQT